MYCNHNHSKNHDKTTPFQWFLVEVRPRSGPVSRRRGLHPWRLRKQWSHSSANPTYPAHPNYRRWAAWSNYWYYIVNVYIVTRSLFCVWRGFRSADWCCPHLQLWELSWRVQEFEWLPVVLRVLWGMLVAQLLCRICAAVGNAYCGTIPKIQGGHYPLSIVVPIHGGKGPRKVGQVPSWAGLMWVLQINQPTSFMGKVPQ